MERLCLAGGVRTEDVVKCFKKVVTIRLVCLKEPGRQGCVGEDVVDLGQLREKEEMPLFTRTIRKKVYRIRK